MEIKPIETEYKGYRFRSRLEARWAVFFDELGIEWGYEQEGFDIDGVRYLPDFTIHVKRAVLCVGGVLVIDDAPVSLVVEIKGDVLTDNDISKLLAFSTYDFLSVAIGLPSEGRMMFMGRKGNEGQIIMPSIFCEVNNDVCIGLYPQDKLAAIVEEKHSALSFSRMMPACEAAKQARFEHGQVGAPSSWRQ